MKLRNTNRRLAASQQKKSEEISYENSSCRDCIAQADICREHARAAAERKRFNAALGLFRTAQGLYSRAATLGGDACVEARERLKTLSVEMATYAELARPRATPVAARVPLRRD
ncbi:MAG TPA: hypothetical protein VF681_08365 [Abditibacteriaceae bacterium]|jgi:hypothetical protein